MDFNLKTDITELMQKLKEIEDKITELASAEDEKLEWYKTDDELIIKSGEYEDQSFGLVCNHINWENAKGWGEKDALYLVIDANEASISTTIGLNEMIQLRDYLNQKIDYLQS